MSVFGPFSPIYNHTIKELRGFYKHEAKLKGTVAACQVFHITQMVYSTNAPFLQASRLLGLKIFESLCRRKAQAFYVKYVN